MIDTERKYGNWSDEATKVEYRKYFRAKERALLGALGNSYRGYEIE